MDRVREWVGRFVDEGPPEIGVVDWLAGLSWPALVALVLALWVPAEILWARFHRSVDAPRIKTRRVRNPAKALRAAKQSRHRDHVFELPGARIVANFLLIQGGSGTGKTKRLLLYLVAHILRSGKRSLFAIDPKGELYGRTWPLLGLWSNRPVVYLISSLKKHRDDRVHKINPMMDDERAAAFVGVSVVGDEPDSGSYFDNASVRMADQARRAQIAEKGGTDATRVYDAMGNPRELDRLATKYPRVLSEWRGSGQARGPHESNRSTFVTEWQGMELSRIRRMFDTGGRWDSGPKWDERTACYLCITPNDAKRAPGIVRALVEDLVDGASSSSDAGGPNATAILEEAGTFAPSGQLEIWVNLFRSAGLVAAIVVQSPHQLRARLGHERTESMFSSIDARVAGPTGSVSDAQDLEHRAGKVRIVPPRPYSPIIVHLLAAIAGLIGDVLESLFSGGQPAERTPEPRQDREKIEVPRYRERYITRIEDDPGRMVGQPFRRTLRRLKMWLTRDHVMADGVYLVLAAGSVPYLLDARRVYFPSYAAKLRPKGV